MPARWLNDPTPACAIFGLLPGVFIQATRSLMLEGGRSARAVQTDEAMLIRPMPVKSFSASKLRFLYIVMPAASAT